MSLRLPIVVSMIAALASACGGSADLTATPVSTTPAAVVTTVLVSPSAPQVEIGTTSVLTADIRDQFGSVMTAKTATWSTSNAAVASIGATSGVLTGVSVGQATVTATVDGRTATASVTVTPVLVASVIITGISGAVLPGQSVALNATAKDRSGNVLTGRAVSWSSSAPTVATVSATGVVNAVSAGSATITAVSEGVSGTTAVVVSPPAGTASPSIATMTPSVLTPGAIATITGSNFIVGAANNTVTIAGVPAAVTAATTTSLTVTVPASGLPCQSTQPVTVNVQNIGGVGSVRQPLAIATTRALAVGASFLATAGGNIGCNELPGPGTYLVSVVNAAQGLNQTAGFELTGSNGGVVASSALLAPSAATRSVSIAAPARTARTSVTAGASATEQQHLAHLEADLQLVKQLGSPRRYRRPARSSSVSGLSPNGAATYSLGTVPTTVGENASINFHFNSCSIAGATPVTARVVYVGPKTIVLEDNASPLAGKIDADMVALAREFETVSYPQLLKFGNPLAYDSQTDANGRLIMLFTPQVNNAGANLLGFVSSCDFFPPTAAVSVAASNLGEIFYARAVTDTSATSTSLNGRPQWRRQMPSTLIHEAKHILSFAERFATPLEASFEETWMEEATAQIASELYGRAIHGNDFRSNSTYKGTIDCEVRPTTAGCNGGIFVMGNHFGFLSDFLQNFESKSILSATDDNDIYGSSWLFARWLVDTYGGNDEAAFLHKLINFSDEGVRNVTAATGKSWAELLTQYHLMLAADELPNVGSPFTLASWNLPGVFAGYNTDFPTSRPAVPLAMRTGSFGPFATTVSSLKGGGGMLLKLTGFSGSQMLDLHGIAGAPLPSTVALSILRVQ